MIRIPINEQGWGLILQLTLNFARSEVGGKAIGLLALLIGLLLGVNGLNIVNSYVGRDFMTAIADRDMPAFFCGGLVVLRGIRGFHRRRRIPALCRKMPRFPLA